MKKFSLDKSPFYAKSSIPFFERLKEFGTDIAMVRWRVGVRLAEESAPLSQVVPLLVAALVCDVAVADPSTGKKNLIGIFDRLLVRQFPSQRPVSVYIKLTDAEGLYKFQVRYVQAGSGMELGRGEGEFRAIDRRASLDLHMTFPPLSIPSEGRYEFQIWANSMFLGSTFIDAVQRP